MTIRILTRSEFAALAGITVEGFKTLNRRNHLTLFSRDERKTDLPGRFGYFVPEAMMMIVAEELVRDGGMDRDLAARLVSESPEPVIDAITAGPSDEPSWIAYVEGADSLSWVESGSITKIAASLAADDDRATIRKVTFVNLSICRRLLFERAERYGIDLAGSDE